MGKICVISYLKNRRGPPPLPRFGLRGRIIGNPPASGCRSDTQPVSRTRLSRPAATWTPRNLRYVMCWPSRRSTVAQNTNLSAQIRSLHVQTLLFLLTHVISYALSVRGQLLLTFYSNLILLKQKNKPDSWYLLLYVNDFAYGCACVNI
jgi:hypothetical protein